MIKARSKRLISSSSPLNVLAQDKAVLGHFFCGAGGSSAAKDPPREVDRMLRADGLDPGRKSRPDGSVTLSLQVQGFDFGPRPGGSSEELQARRYAGIVREAPYGNAPAHFRPADPLDQFTQHLLQRNAVKRIVDLWRSHLLDTWAASILRHRRPEGAAQRDRGARAAAVARRLRRYNIAAIAVGYGSIALVKDN